MILVGYASHSNYPRNVYYLTFDNRYSKFMNVVCIFINIRMYGNEWDRMNYR